ncbi:transportin MOS14 isoform X3 [Zea mays]|uniref:Transportin MOS14 n=1 Tax=Zea mays TaxID=4577 RepID=A0A804PAS2_MAIZE|nr:transportin MOS14 isoform X3 [Zea mays]|eukprot:XP_008644787.1 transportin MOS14 isoform X3 [Zea mays]
MEAQATATVKEALAALYHHPDDAIRTAADRWLQEFQHTLDAWQVADSLLHDESSNLETLIFCSQTLRSKVQRDFEELPSEAFRSLQDSLYVLLKKFNKGPQKVRTQICIAIAALAVHVPVEDWGAGGIVNWLSDEMKTHPEFIPGFLELLIVLPQETSSYKIAARPERRRQFEIDLCSSANVAIDLLTACMAIDQLKEQVLEGFSSWLRFCHGISASELASHPLVHLALSSLNSGQFLEAAVNVTSELIHATVSHGAGTMAEQVPLIQILVPHIMGLKEQLKDPSKDEEDVKAIARLYADMGESYVDLIATGSDDSIQIVNALLEVTSLLEFAISSMTFNFWHCLKRNLIRRDSDVSYGLDVTVEIEKNRRLQIFRPKFETLVSLAYGSCNNEQNSKWQPVEATLFCIQAIARSVSIEEREILPQIMSLLPCLPQHEQLLQTVCLTIGAFSKWIDAAPAELSILPPLVDILNKGMSTSEDTAAAASMAFKYICEDCRTKFSGSLDGLFQIYHIAISGVGGYKVSSEDSLHLVEALSVIITTLPPESASRALELICQPVINPLQEFIQQGDQVLQRVPARHLTVHIDRLSSIFSNVKQPEVVAEAVYRYWPTLKSIFDQRAWDTRTMESICRSCKFAVRTCGRFMGMTIGAMLEEIQTLYQQHKQSCFLYLSSEVIKIFGSDPSCAGYLTSLIQILFSHTVQLLRTIQDFTARPDIADDCYLLASRCIRYCPDLFIPTETFQRLVDCAMAGITIHHREACKSILSFLSDVIDLPNSSGGGQYREVINTIILQRGTTLTRIMIAALTGALPSGRLEEVSYVLLSLSRAFGEDMLNWARESINLIPPQALTDAERLRFFNIISDATSGSSLHNITDRFGEISDICRRNKTVQDLVQSALRPQDLTVTVVRQQM